jgi:hypothetical protein
MTAPGAVACIIDVLPGGGSAKELAAGNPSICALPASYLKNGRINNVLLAQTITLALNVNIVNPSGLGGFVLQAGVFATADIDGDCGSTTPKVRVCNYNPLAPYNLVSVTNQYLFKSISQAVVDAIVGTKNVSGLLELANNALANTDGVVGFENGATLADINDAVSHINEGFDECRIFIGWNVAPCPAFDPSVPSSPRITTTAIAEESVQTLTVNAFPNPFRNRVNFVIASPVSGKASLEVYNMFGQKVKTVYQGYITAGRSQVVEYRAPEIINQSLIYIFRVGDKKVTGKLINLE